MDKKKMVKTITIIALAVATGFLIWKIIVYPLIDFYKKEKELTKAGEEYFERNTSLKPDEGEVSTVTLETLIKQKYIISMRSTYGKKGCDYKNSWVKLKRKEGEYKYITNLQCGTMKSTVDNEGPTIKLKGKEEIEIEKGTKYTDEGIESVYDNTDGKMNTKDVIVTGKVNTNKIGTYKIEYEAVDSLGNKTTIERTINIIQTLNKVVKDDTKTNKVYQGENPNNYIEFSNMLFRIVGINDDGSIKIVSSEPVGVVNYKDINKWLNEYFYSHLTDKAKKYIVEKDFCSSKVTDKDIKTTKACDKKTKQKVGLLSAKDYNLSVKDENSYLYRVNNGWVNDYESDKKGWTIRTSGVYEAFDIDNNYSLYPVVNLKKGIKITKGNGTKEYPYEFSKVSSGKTGDLINTRYTGEYVSYAETLYRIIEGNDNGSAKVILVTEINNLESHLADPGESIYNPKKKGNIGYYLENKVSKEIKTDIFAKREIEVPIYDNIATYSGKKTTKKYSVKLAAPNMYEMFSAVGGNCWLINSSKNKNINYMVDMLNNVKYKDISQFEINLIKFTGYLDKDTTILSGKGTLTNPYILQR